jgi:glycosyltransferase involved in cell wall biosynthesis
MPVPVQSPDSVSREAHPSLATPSACVVQLVGNFSRGGSETQAVQLAGLLKKSGRFDVRMAVLDSEGVMREEAVRLGFVEIPEYPLGSFYGRSMWRQTRRFAAQLREWNAQVIQTHDFYSNVFGMIAGAWARVPVRIAARREIAGLRTPKQQMVERQVYKLARAIVANSGAVRDGLVQEGVNPQAIEIIHNGLDLSRVTPQQLGREEMLSMLGLPSGKRWVTIVANLRHAVKDHPTFLRAAQRVHQKFPDAAFAIAGEGELLPEMRDLASSLGLGQAAHFMGRCHNVADLLAISDVCVLSSQWEGFSNSVLEYMAAGRPVVATQCGGTPEAVVEGETGYLVPVQDYARMADRIVSLLSDPDKARRMGERGRQVVEQKFSCAAQLRNTEELYARLLNQEARR